MMASVSGRRSVSAEPRPGVLDYIDLAAQPVDRALDDIQTDTTTGDAGDLMCRGKTGQENHLEHFVVSNLCTRREQAVLLGASANARAIKAAPVVHD